MIRLEVPQAMFFFNYMWKLSPAGLQHMKALWEWLSALSMTINLYTFLRVPIITEAQVCELPFAMFAQRSVEIS